jgi:hypothetical protein
LGLTACFASGADPVKPVITADRIVGEWYVETVRSEGSYIIVLTFRPNGVWRFDALDPTTRKRAQIPEERLGNQVGLWKIDGSDVVIMFERWSEADQRPYQKENRWRIKKLTAKDLEYTVIDKELNRESPPARWQRFGGWGKKE